MPITSAHIKEGLSLAYVHAVTARAGLSLQHGPVHDYGVDGTIRQVAFGKGRYFESGIALDFQLKATTIWELQDASLVYDLDAAAHRHLALRNSKPRALPCILLVYGLDPCESKWLSISENSLISRKCCYWTYITSVPTENSSSQRISIPRSNVFDVPALLTLISDLEE